MTRMCIEAAINQSAEKMMLVSGTLLLTRKDVSELLTLKDCIQAVEQAFRLQGEGRAAAPGVLGVHAQSGGFHIKAGILPLSRNYFAAKTNANFPGNPSRGLPTIQGVILLFDADNGQVLAVMDSMEITKLRTGAATAVAAKYLVRKGSRVATICGCGNQGRVQLQAISHVFPLEEVFSWDIHRDVAERFALAMAAELGIVVMPVSDLSVALRQSDICVTCTPAKKFFIQEERCTSGNVHCGRRRRQRGQTGTRSCASQV
jgi:alanine dehydrogenase